MKLLWALGAAGLAASTVMASVPAGAEGSTRQDADVFTFADLPDLVDVGDSRLIRTATGVTAHVATTGLRQGPHTVWWVVWNNPDECGAACTAADFGDPDVDVDIGYATGVVVGASGRANFNAHLSEGAPLTGFPAEFGITSGSGLVDGEGAEVHLVVRSHGPAIPGLVGEMTRTFHAGCDYSVFGGLLADDSYGTEGPNLCQDMHFAIHN